MPLLIYSVGWELGERERAAITQVPGLAWQIAIDHRGEVRERRADEACGERQCAHRRCWVEEAHVTELTGLLRESPGGDQLDGWPATMRVFAHRERPHPGAQLTLFEAEDGWRYSLWVTNLPARLRGWRASLAYIDAAHRVHARVEDGVRTGKDTGLGKFPSVILSPADDHGSGLGVCDVDGVANAAWAGAGWRETAFLGSGSPGVSRPAGCAWRTPAARCSPIAWARACRSCWLSASRWRIRAVAASSRRCREAAEARCWLGMGGDAGVSRCRWRRRSIWARTSVWA